MKNKNTASKVVKREGYRPLNEGYTPVEKRGYDGAKTTEKLPKAPPGGTGQTTLVSNGNNAGGGKK